MSLDRGSVKGSFIVVQRVSGFARVTLIRNIVFLMGPLAEFFKLPNVRHTDTYRPGNLCI